MTPPQQTPEVITSEYVPPNYSHKSGNEKMSRWFIICSNTLVFIVTYLLFRKGSLDAQLQFFQVDEAGQTITTKTWADWYFLVAFVCLACYRFSGLYSQRWIIWNDFKVMLFVLAFACPIDLALVYSMVQPANKLYALVNWGFIFVALPVVHWWSKLFLIRIGLWQKPTIIIGTGDNARQTCLTLMREKILGFDVKYFIDVDKSSKQKQYKHIASFDLPVIKVTGAPLEFFKKLGTPHIVVALEEQQMHSTHDVIDVLTLRPNSVDIVPPVRGIALYGLDVHHIFGNEILLLRTRNNLARRFPRLVKRLTDVMATFILLVILSPVFAVISWLVSRDGGPVFYSHRRVGYKGRLFSCYKFRSMKTGAKEQLEALLKTDEQARKEWDSGFKLKNDPRITKIGKFLRNTSLDELPQLFNVLTGDMSLVGPRPIVEAEVARYGNNSGYYLEVRPGITGLWQISGRSDIDYAYRVRLDIWYIKNWSFWYDLVILLKTIPVVFKKQGAY